LCPANQPTAFSPLITGRITEASPKTRRYLKPTFLKHTTTAPTAYQTHSTTGA